jgi:hypothetical protein
MYTNDHISNGNGNDVNTSKIDTRSAPKTPKKKELQNKISLRSYTDALLRFEFTALEVPGKIYKSIC